MKIHYDSEELLMICESQEVLQTLTEMKRVLVLYSKSKNISSHHIKDTAKSYNDLSEIAHQLNKNSCFKFYKKYNFFKSGVRIEFLN